MIRFSLTTSFFLCNNIKGKQRRLKQAKEEAHEEIERYQKEREKQFKEFEAKVCKKLLTFTYHYTFFFIQIFFTLQSHS